MSGPGRVGRLRADVRRRVGGRVAGAVGMDELAHLDATVDSLAVAVRENRELEAPLEGLVDALERDVAEVLAWRSRTGDDGEVGA
ncbi:hypothetical protein [Nocardioides hwasunensis]|uniref:Uncharacterized protein n=1 Tax=Nocardioides hwasunensis TaxID=397258 RepID=A0ABR8MGW5_9ACTN|nr:hypothetical protein [Nocardioides hwasunensis]MBD3914331.1 hypothetical protein [Nocardioides hwasunensis]